MKRRSFLQWLGTLTASMSGLRAFANVLDSHSNPVLIDVLDNATPPPAFVEGYGTLVADAQKILKLPKGFSYQIISRAGDKMNDGLLSPGRPDGMGAFEGKHGKVILVRNHENSYYELKQSAFNPKNQLFKSHHAAKMYDAGFGKTPCLGGTTTLIYNERTQKLERSYLSLGGTSRNCAGGVAPWGAWLTCEEDFQSPSEKYQKRHGYVFEVKATENIKLQKAVPIKSMGRFNHEAVAIDPRTGIVYLTEDRHEGLFYRFVPREKFNLAKGGTLQALAFTWKKSMDTRNWKNSDVEVGKSYSVYWQTLLNVDSDKDDLRFRGFKQGAARFARGEGIWFGNDEVYIACTNGGRRKAGQIFRYKPSRWEGTKKERDARHRAQLELFVEPNDFDLLRYCDNLTVAPWGDVVFVEDNDHPRIIGITPDGKFYKIAENIGFQSELAGVCFSPSGKTMFVNIQEAGLTLAITGNWAKRKV